LNAVELARQKRKAPQRTPRAFFTRPSPFTRRVAPRRHVAKLRYVKATGEKPPREPIAGCDMQLLGFLEQVKKEGWDRTFSFSLMQIKQMASGAVPKRS
jgi:hypothetical protein